MSMRGAGNRGGARGALSDQLAFEAELLKPDEVASLKKTYPGFSKRTIESLACMDEEVVNLDLIEMLLLHISETSEEGAILVFMPGLMEVSCLFGCSEQGGNPADPS